MKINNIDTKDISVVVQGAITRGVIEKCLNSIRKYLPGATIILSTWEGSDVSNLDYDKLLLNKDPGASGYRENVYKNPEKKIPNNINRQILSTLNGLKIVETKYAMKLRTDFELFGNKFLKYFDQFPKNTNDNNIKIFEKKVLAFVFLPEDSAKIPFYISDHSFFGLSDDLLKLFDIPLQNTTENMWMENHEPANKELFIKYFCTPSSRFSPETYIVLNAFNKINNNIFNIVRDWTDDSESNLKLGEKFIVNNFIVLDSRQYNIRAIYKKYLSVLIHYRSFERYIELYKKYCDINFLPSIKLIGFVEYFNIDKEINKIKKNIFKILQLINNIFKFLIIPIKILLYSFKIIFKIFYTIIISFLNNNYKFILFKLKKELLKNNKKNKNKIAIFVGSSGAIAEWTIKTHSINTDDYDIFVDAKKYKEYLSILSFKKNNINNIYPFYLYKKFKKRLTYKAKIFVLGDSYHNINALSEAINSKNEKNRYLLIHDGCLFGLLYTYIKEENIDNFISKYYKNKKINTQKLYTSFLENKIFFIKPIIELTSINNIIALDKKVKELILKDNSNNKDLKIESIFLPTEEINNVDNINLKEEKEQYILGIFGGFNPEKKPIDKILKALEILNKKLKVKLIIVGSGVEKFFQEKKYSKNNIQIFEKPDSKLWLKLLNSVDLALELREEWFGYSSGVISELTGLKKKILITDAWCPDDLKDYYYTASQDVSCEELSNIIEKILKNQITKKQISNYIFEKYGFNSLSNKIKEIVINNLGEKDE